MLESLAKLDWIDRVEGLARSIRRAPGLRGQHRRRLVGVKRIEWPRMAASGGEIEELLKRYNIKISGRGFTGDERDGVLWLDVASVQHAWAQYLIDDYLEGRLHAAWRDGPAAVQRAAERVANIQRQQAGR